MSLNLKRTCFNSPLWISQIYHKLRILSNRGKIFALFIIQGQNFYKKLLEQMAKLQMITEIQGCKGRESLIFWEAINSVRKTETFSGLSAFLSQIHLLADMICLEMGQIETLPNFYHGKKLNEKKNRLLTEDHFRRCSTHPPMTTKII